MKKYYLLILVVTSLLTSCKQQDKMQENKDGDRPIMAEEDTVSFTREQYKLTAIQLGSLKTRTINNFVKASGYLKLPPQKLAEVSVFMGGVIKEITVIEGDKVVKGQTLAILEHPDYIILQENYLKSRDNLNYLSQEYDRQKELMAENVGIKKSFQQTEASYNAEQARSSSLKSQLQLLGLPVKSLEDGHISPFVCLKSPIDGYVSKILVNIGTFAEPAKPSFEVVDNSHIHADLMVYEKDFMNIKKGQEVVFTLPNQEGKKYTGIVFAVGKTFDQQTRSLAIHAEILNHEGKSGLVPGIYINAYILTGTQQTETLPEAAVVKFSGKNYIFILDTIEQRDTVYKFKMEELKTGITDSGYVAVEQTPNLTKSDGKIVVNGSYALLAKLKSPPEEQ